MCWVPCTCTMNISRLPSYLVELLHDARGVLYHKQGVHKLYMWRVVQHNLSRSSICSTNAAGSYTHNEVAIFFYLQSWKTRVIGNRFILFVIWVISLNSCVSRVLLNMLWFLSSLSSSQSKRNRAHCRDEVLLENSELMRT